MTALASTHTQRRLSAGLLADTLARLKQHVLRVRTQRLLRELDDRQLKDIGLSRGDLGSW